LNRDFHSKDLYIIMKKDEPRKDFYKNVSWLVKPVYDWIDKYREGLAPFSKGGKWGYLNSVGEIIIKPQFDQVMEFSEEMAGVCINNKWGFINTSGRFVIEPRFDERPDIFHEGLVRIAVKTAGFRGKETMYGFADVHGELLIPPVYRDAGYFSYWLAPAQIDNKYGYIDKTGRFVIEEIFDHALNFANNRALVCLNQKWGIIKHPLYANSLNELLEKRLNLE